MDASKIFGDALEIQPKNLWILRNKKVSNEVRHQLLDFIVNKKMKIVEAAHLLNVKYENAKAIYRVYRKEGRITKKIFKKRKSQ